MEILIGLGAAAALLYYWLLAHWFARVLVFLGLAVVVVIATILVGRSGDVGATFFVLVIGVVGAWYGSGVPIYYRNHRFIEGLRMLDVHADPAKLREIAKSYGRG